MIAPPSRQRGGEAFGPGAEAEAGVSTPPALAAAVFWLRFACHIMHAEDEILRAACEQMTFLISPWWQ